MKLTFSITIFTILFSLNACRQVIKHSEPINYEYFDLALSDTVGAPLFAVTDEKFLRYGARVAYVNNLGDTIIPFGKYAYYGTDTLIYYAEVLENINGRQVGINRDQKVLFDLVMFDNGPEPFNEGLKRVLRNGKMGYVNKYGHVVIPCIYDYAKWFEGGRAEVTFNATEYIDGDEHRRVESDEWFKIDKKGKKVN